MWNFSPFIIVSLCLQDGQSKESVISRLVGAKIGHRYGIINGFSAELTSDLVDKVYRTLLEKKGFFKGSILVPYLEPLKVP